MDSDVISVCIFEVIVKTGFTVNTGFYIKRDAEQ